jgi:hypothetical protein
MDSFQESLVLCENKDRMIVPKIAACFMGLIMIQAHFGVGQDDPAAKGKQILDSHQYPETINPTADSTKSDLRLARAMRYNTSSQRKLTQVQSDVAAPHLLPWILLRDRESMPVADSTTIAIGSVHDNHSYFSEDETAIYSEYSFSIIEVLRSVELTKPSTGESLLCSREGGSIALANGSRATWYVPGQGYPKVGEQYLLFIRWNENEQIFKILRAYLFSEAKVFSIDSAADNQQPYAGVSIESFVAQVKSKILAYEKNCP